MTDPKDRKRGGLRKPKQQETRQVASASKGEERSFSNQIAISRMSGTYDKWLREWYGLFRWGEEQWPNGGLIDRLRSDKVLSEGQLFKDNMYGVEKWLRQKYNQLGRVKAQKPPEPPKKKPLERLR